MSTGLVLAQDKYATFAVAVVRSSPVFPRRNSSHPRCALHYQWTANEKVVRESDIKWKYFLLYGRALRSVRSH